MTSAPNKPEILIVEDNSLIRFLLRLALDEGQINGPVKEAANGREALDLITIAGTAPDIILLDIYMPTMNGIDFLEAFKNSGLYTGRTIIYILTSDAGSENFNRFMATGMVKNYFNKPLTQLHVRQIRNDLKLQ